MATPLESRRIVIAGASSLLGAELKALLEESRFAASDFRLVDEETVAGMLTEAGGEPAVIQPVEEDSFDKAWIVFFAGSPEFTKRNLDLAKRSGARIVDLSGALAGTADARTWLPGVVANNPATAGSGRVVAVPSAHAEIIARLAAALHTLYASSLSAVAFQPVSGAGAAGIEELESQTGQRLSFQPPGKAVFDAEVAFSMLDRYGPSSRHKLDSSLQILRKEIQSCLSAELSMPAVQLLHAPVFYGATVSVCAMLKSAVTSSQIKDACVAAGFHITHYAVPPSNFLPGGQIELRLAAPESDSGVPGGWWFWAAADNLRLPAVNAVKLAEKLIE